MAGGAGARLFLETLVLELYEGAMVMLSGLFLARMGEVAALVGTALKMIQDRKHTLLRSLQRHERSDRKLKVPTHLLCLFLAFPEQAAE